MKQTFAVAAAEFRSLRRTAQTWIVVAVAVGAGLAPFLYYSVAHGIRSGYGATAGSVSPRFLIHGFGDLTLVAMMAGVVLLVVNALARDRGDGIADVVAARPPSNLPLVAGRTGALVLAAWLAPTLLALATLAFGGATLATDFWTGDFVEPWSLGSFLLLDAPVALAAWTALVVFLRVALGSAWAAAATAFALIALQVWALFALPAWLLSVISLLPRFAAISSDVMPEFADGAVVQRFALLLLAGGARCLAAAAPMRERQRRACPRCDGVLRERRGPFGLFVGCSNYPGCGYTREGRQRRAMPPRSNGVARVTPGGTGDGIADSDLAALAGDPGREVLVTVGWFDTWVAFPTIRRPWGAVRWIISVEILWKGAVLLQPGKCGGDGGAAKLPVCSFAATR